MANILLGFRMLSVLEMLDLMELATRRKYIFHLIETFHT